MEAVLTNIGVFALLTAALFGGAFWGAVRANGPEAPVLGMVTLAAAVPGTAILALLVAAA